MEGVGTDQPRGQPLTSQAIGMLLRNRLYIGIIDVPDFGIRDQRGDFDPVTWKLPVSAAWQKPRPIRSSDTSQASEPEPHRKT